MLYGEVIVCRHSHAIISHDPKAHFETSAVGRARLALSIPDQSGCTLYATIQAG